MSVAAPLPIGIPIESAGIAPTPARRNRHRRSSVSPKPNWVGEISAAVVILTELVRCWIVSCRAASLRAVIFRATIIKFHFRLNAPARTGEMVETVVKDDTGGTANPDVLVDVGDAGLPVVAGFIGILECIVVNLEVPHSVRGAVLAMAVEPTRIVEGVVAQNHSTVVVTVHNPVAATGEGVVLHVNIHESRRVARSHAVRGGPRICVAQVFDGHQEVVPLPLEYVVRENHPARHADVEQRGIRQRERVVLEDHGLAARPWSIDGNWVGQRARSSGRQEGNILNANYA